MLKQISKHHIYSFLNTSMNGDLHHFPEQPVKCLNTLSVKKYFLLSYINLTRHSLMLCPLITCYLIEDTDPHLSTTPAATTESSEEHSDTLFPCARSHSNTRAVVAGFGPPIISARVRRSQQRSGLRSEPPAGTAPAPPEPGGDRPAAGLRGRGQLRGCAGGCSRRPPGGFPEGAAAAEGAGRASGRALPKGLRRTPDGADGVDWRNEAPPLPPSIPPFPPPRGWSLPWAAPPAPPRSVTPVRAPPPVSAGRSWGRVLPCLRRSPSTRPHPARPRDARVSAGAAGGEGRRGAASNSWPWERGGGRSGAARGGGAGSCPWRGSRDAGPAAGDAGERRGPGGMGVRVARRAEECLLETIIPRPPRSVPV